MSQLGERISGRESPAGVQGCTQTNKAETLNSGGCIERTLHDWDSGGNGKYNTGSTLSRLLGGRRSGISRSLAPNAS